MPNCAQAGNVIADDLRAWLDAYIDLTTGKNRCRNMLSVQKRRVQVFANRMDRHSPCTTETPPPTAPPTEPPTAPPTEIGITNPDLIKAGLQYCSEADNGLVQQPARLVGGAAASVGEWPALVQLLNSEHDHECHGVVIGNHWVLTEGQS